jgi:hypothetical protein
METANSMRNCVAHHCRRARISHTAAVRSVAFPWTAGASVIFCSFTASGLKKLICLAGERRGGVLVAIRSYRAWRGLLPLDHPACGTATRWSRPFTQMRFARYQEPR